MTATTAPHPTNDLTTIQTMLRVGRDHNRYDQIRIACMLAYGETLTGQAERTLR